MADEQWWFNTSTGEVEQGHRSAWGSLMGPYASAEQARDALRLAKERNEAWDAEEAGDR